MRPRRSLRACVAVACTLAAIAIALRLALPSYLQSYVNRVLDESPDYNGSAGEIDVSLLRGRYTIHDLRVVKRLHAVQVPFFECERIDLAVDWRSLLHGVARGRVRMLKPHLNFAHGPSSDDDQTGADQPWLSMLNDLSPFRIDKAQVVDGEVHFHTFHTEPRVDVYLSDIRGDLSNLTNVTGATDPLPATLHATGRAMETGDFRFDLTLDPESHRPTLAMAMQLLNVDVTRLNNLARAYGDFDFEHGHFDLVVEASIHEGRLEGYAEPLFRDVTVLSLRDIRTKDPLHVLWEALVEGTGAVFKNHSRDQFGTRFAIQGDLDDPNVSILEVIGNTLRNAFVRAYLPRIEGRVLPEAVTAHDQNHSKDTP